MSAAIDIQGMKFGALTVKRRVASIRDRAAWECVCDCGVLVVRTGPDLRNSIKTSSVPSCGCKKVERFRQIGLANRTHGFTKGSTKKLYDVWKQMHYRCYRPGCKDYPAYGARGIIICDDWHSIDKFVDWAIKSGYRNGLTIERKDVNKSYTPNNCTWIENCMQARNTRKNIRITFQGRNLCLSEWSVVVGIHIQTLLLRYRNGWDAERLLTTRPEHGRNQFS